MSFFSPEVIITIISSALGLIVGVVGLWLAYVGMGRQQSHDPEASMLADNLPLTPPNISSGSLDNIMTFPDVAHLRQASREPGRDRRPQVPPRMLRARSLPC